jgi:hypothetical protein
MKRRLLVMLGYMFAAVFVVGFTVALVAYGNDYTYDFKSGKIVQRGHVIIQSIPGGIRVNADGKTLSKKTPYQAVYSVGKHTFTLAKDGYHPWTKQLEVLAGQVTLVSYAILVPKQPEKVQLDTKPAITAQSISKDHRHLAYITGGANPAVYTLEISDKKPVRLYTPKAATPEAPAEALAGVSWSDDASHILIRSTIGPQVIYRLADVSSGAEPINLTDQYKFDFSSLMFSWGNWRQLYWVSSDGGLRRLDVESQSVSVVLADKVSQFWVVPDRILYVQQTDLGRTLWSMDNRGKRQEVIPALPESDSYSVAYGEFDGREQLAVVPSKTQTGTLYVDIFSDTPVAKVVAHGVMTADFSPDGHLVVFSAPQTLVSYDIERSQLQGKDAIYTVSDQPGVLSSLTWFDNYHLLSVRDGRLYWSEYDGANRVDLGPAAAPLPAHRSADFKSIITYQPEGSSVRINTLKIRE